MADLEGQDLMDAASDLLDALKNLVIQVKADAVFQRDIRQAEDAIAKAESRTSKEEGK